MGPSSQPAIDNDCASHRTQSLHTDIAIVGAGPVGLMLANILGLQGVRVTLIEKLPEIIDYPRAIGLDDEAFRVFQSVGLAEKLLPHTTLNHWMRFTLRGECFASIEPRTDEFGWPRRNAFIQPLADKILYQGLERFSHVTSLLGHEVSTFTQDDAGVRLEVSGPDGIRKTVHASYMVGADGGNSAVRRALNVPFEGRTKPNQWIVVDVRNDPIGSPHLYLHCDAKRPYVSAALPHGIRRFEFMVMPGETEEELSRPDNMAALMRHVVADPEKVDYIRKRVYTHNARLAQTFRVKRVFLAGDAAHIMPVWQGQGYNSGIRDASNLGWKLVAVMKGQAADGLLDTYTMERRAHARSMIHLSEVAGDIFAPTSRLGSWARDRLVSAFKVIPSLKRYVVEMRFKPMPRYEQGGVLSSATPRKNGMIARLLARSGHSAPGRLLGLMSENRASWIGRLAYGRDPSASTPVGRMFIQPKVRLQDGKVVRLDDAIGNRFAIVAWGANPTFGMSDSARALWKKLGGCFVIVKPDCQLQFHDDVPDEAMALGDVDGRLKDWFAAVPESVIVLRPDRFVAALCSPQRISETIQRLSQKLSMPDPELVAQRDRSKDPVDMTIAAEV
ncbi:bifunctional 3-(3-hydroxy-phenyl)propionate/3-hydroxycinnamic acid hydroxylase [Herbaspirillum sp. NPDC087042]|uniref:bifunctional 3-(3-hydroxy-phenyl)propionate/3-hydroxycinnamic acid hydroxylase n=1 Tax=Herbaspirillum sp. NPDC087042 TaxID=3364004 RepID=UPI003803E3B1